MVLHNIWICIICITCYMKWFSLASDVLIIRHGRSRVRHSSEKDHLRAWSLKALDTSLPLHYNNNNNNNNNDNDTIEVTSGNQSYYVNGSDGLFYVNNGSGSSNSGERNNTSYYGITPEYPISSGRQTKENVYNSNIFDVGSGRSSSTKIPHNNGHNKIINNNTLPFKINNSTTKKKLVKKQIMANVRKTVDKGLEYIKSHAHLHKENIDNNANRASGTDINQEDKNAFKDYGISTDLTTTTQPPPPSSPSTSPTQRPITSKLQKNHVQNDLNNILLDNIDNQFKDNDLNKLIDDTMIVTTEYTSNDKNKLAPSSSQAAQTKNFSNLFNLNTDNKNGQMEFEQSLRLNATEETKNYSEYEASEGGAGGGGGGIDYMDSGLYSETNEHPNDFPIKDIDLSETTDFINVYHQIDDYDGLDETSRNNRLSLMRGRDVVTKFLQIVETQHLLGSNCTAGTALNLGEGVVDRYAHDRFRVEAEVAVNRANMLTRIFKLSTPEVQASEHLLHASVLSMVEFDDDIFAAGNCFDWNQHPLKKGLFCPFAYRLPGQDQGASFAKDLAAEYDYLGNTSEWFFLARKNAEKVIIKNEQYIKAYHLYSNSTDREADKILSVKYEDGRWSKPYYDCGGGNIWMLTYTVPFFGHDNGTYFFKGTSGIDIDLRRVDIDQCPQRHVAGTTQPLNLFAGTDKCKQNTTECVPISGLGFRRGSYKCICRKGFYFPDTSVSLKYFNGSTLEEEYEKLMLNELSTYNNFNSYECLPCAEGCDACKDASPCVAALNWPMRTSILVLACAVIGFLPPAAYFTFRYQQVKVLRAASPALLRVIALGAFLIYCTSIVMYPPPSLYTCTARIWLREIGFSLTYGALMLKTWRISVIFRVRSAKAVKITDGALLKRLGVLCACIGVALLVRTIVAPPLVVVGRTADDLKAYLCKTDWWDYTFTSMEVLFLAWGVRLCIMVRKAPSEFNESRFISMAIYNEFLLTCFLNVSMIFLQSPANPDLLYIIFFCHTQLTVTLLLALIFGSKVYLVFRSGGKPSEDTMGMGIKASGTKFVNRSQARTLANPSTATSSTVQLGGNTEIRLTEQEAMEQIRKLCLDLQSLQDRAPPRGVAIATIATLLDICKTTRPLQICPAILPKTALLIIKSDKSTNTNVSLTDFCAQHFCCNDLCDAAAAVIHQKLQRYDSEKRRSLNQRQLCAADSDNSPFLNLHLECMCVCNNDLTDDKTSEPSSLKQRSPNLNCNCNNLKRRIEPTTNNVVDSLLIHDSDAPKIDEANKPNHLKCSNQDGGENCILNKLCENHTNCNYVNLNKFCTKCDDRFKTIIEHKVKLVSKNSNNLILNSLCQDNRDSCPEEHKIPCSLVRSELSLRDKGEFCQNEDISSQMESNSSPIYANSGQKLPSLHDTKSINSVNGDQVRDDEQKAKTETKSDVDGSISNINANKRSKTPDSKLVLDLNDRSKYTKEVSV